MKMKQTTTMRNLLAKIFSLAAIISLFAFAPMKSSAQFLCGAGFQYSVIQGTTNVQFYDSSNSAFGHTCLWSFDNGTTMSNQYNPLVQFNSSGFIYVCLTITDTINGCTATTCDSIYLNPSGGGCSAYFTSTVVDSLVSFTDASSSGTNSWAWDFGDNSNGTGANPTHIYVNPGYYLVCLYTTDSAGCSSSYCGYVYISGGSTGCTAGFSAANNSGNSITFSNTSSSGVFTNYYWDFGDGSTSNQMNPTHTYTTSGSYVVCLTIVDSLNNFCTDTYCDSVYVNGGSSSCNASFSYNANVNTVAFVNTSTGNYTNAQWSFGDGTGATG